MTMLKLAVFAAPQITAANAASARPSLISEGKAGRRLLRAVLFLGCLIALIGLATPPETIAGAAYAQQCPNGQCPPE